MKQHFYIFILLLVLSFSSCGLAPIPLLNDNNSSMVERKSFGNQTGTESNGSILINLPNVGLTRIYCAQCHHNSNTGSTGNLVFTNADFNSVHQKSTTEIQQLGYRLPLTPQ